MPKYDRFNISYDDYIAAQKQHERSKSRTVNKRAVRLKDIATMKAMAPTAKKVLCVGARDPSEVKDFLDEGYEALGIDLFSNNPLIRVMDMNELGSNFAEAEFDIGYSSHSLEHSYEPEKVVLQLRKVCALGVHFVLPKNDARLCNAKDPIAFDFGDGDAAGVEKWFSGVTPCRLVSFEYRADGDEISFTLLW